VSSNNASKWEMGFNSAFKGLKQAGLILEGSRLTKIKYYVGERCFKDEMDPLCKGRCHGFHDF